MNPMSSATSQGASALVAAGLYDRHDRGTTMPSPALPAAALAATRAARVDLYLDHQQAAIHHLREARQALTEAGAPREVVAHLEHASWSVLLHHDYHEAVAEMDAALDWVAQHTAVPATPSAP